MPTYTIHPQPSGNMTLRLKTLALVVAGTLTFMSVPAYAATTPTDPGATTQPTPTPDGSALSTDAVTPSVELIAAAESAKITELEQIVSDLNLRAEEISLELTTATAEYETGKKELKDAQESAAKSAAGAAVKEIKAEDARQGLAQIARASARSGGMDDTTAMLSVVTGSSDEVLREAEYIDRLGQTRADTAASAVDLADVAATQKSEAADLKDVADSAAEDLETKLSSVQTEAATASLELTTKVQELDVARLEAAQLALNAQIALEATQASELAALLAASAGLTSTLDVPYTGPLGAECVAEAPSSYPTSQNWGGWTNGLIPQSALCPIRTGHALRWDAAAAFRSLNAAYTVDFGTEICVTDSYRSYDAQVRLFAQKPGLAATPGKSNHGWGLAVDFCGGINNFGTPQYEWMKLNAPQHGWFHPDWAEPSGSMPEAWHWEYGQIS